MLLRTLVASGIAVIILVYAIKEPETFRSSAKSLKIDPALGWANETMPQGMKRGEQPGEYIWEKDGSVMVYVPAGEFTMGRDFVIPSEKPVHKVKLSAFYIDKYEVTRGAFNRFVTATGYKTNAERKGVGNIIRPKGMEQAPNKSWRDVGFPQNDSHPVVLVSWDDAKAYTTWSGKSLPTEAQWEKAASWDTTAGKKRSYPWGDTPAAGRDVGTKDPPLRGNFADTSFAALMPAGQQKDYLLDPNFGGNYEDGFVYTAPVGSFSQGVSPVGAFEMMGNVWEWCEDFFAENYYSRSPAENPVNTASSPGRAIRGMGYDEPSTTPKPTTSRASVPPTESFTTIGFRCVVAAV